jgi:hypothetical protein
VLCPHCGGLIDVVAAKPLPDFRQGELPFVVELRLPSSTENKHAKKIVDASEQNPKNAARARPRHDHALSDFCKPLGHEHDHDHGGHELSAEEEDLLSQIDELVRSENRALHFRRTWILRIKDYPNQVFAAIGETRSAKREGKVKRSIGGVLNWHFEKFRDAALQRRDKRKAS